MKPSRGLMAPHPIISKSHCCHSVRMIEPLTFNPSVLANVRSTNRPPWGSTSLNDPIRTSFHKANFSSYESHQAPIGQIRNIWFVLQPLLMPCQGLRDHDLSDTRQQHGLGRPKRPVERTLMLLGRDNHDHSL